MNRGKAPFLKDLLPVLELDILIGLRKGFFRAGGASHPPRFNRATLNTRT